ncbi:MAG TPA: pyridoxamine 5'-phosphate oxidase family protein [Woeseiaceae bacterium]|nr:pyridoxamine 5'-phosphate oxidase family protein [Woeseiaceae bacterium]
MDTDRLDDLLQRCWDYLEEGAGSARSPFHTAVLGSIEAGAPHLRTVVLRSADRGACRVLCHTDARSAKARQIDAGAPVSWLLYDPQRKVQLRLQGQAAVHAGDALAEQRWRASAAGSRRCYLVEPGPGAVLASRGSTLPEALRHRRPEAEETAPGWANFAVVAAAVESIDWLHLTADGHRRARFRRRADGWESDWIAP